MVALLTLDVGKKHLRVDHSDDDADIADKIEQASTIIVNYIKAPDEVRPWSPLPPSGWDDTNVPKDIKAAVQIRLSRLYDDRNAGKELNEVALGYLTPAETAILHRWRDPAMA
jgi:hypothetical protein